MKKAPRLLLLILVLSKFVTFSTFATNDHDDGARERKAAQFRTRPKIEITPEALENDQPAVKCLSPSCPTPPPGETESQKLVRYLSNKFTNREKGERLVRRLSSSSTE